MDLLPASLWRTVACHTVSQLPVSLESSLHPPRLSAVNKGLNSANGDRVYNDVTSAIGLQNTGMESSHLSQQALKRLINGRAILLSAVCEKLAVNIRCCS